MPVLTPPPISNTISLSVVPIGTSIRPVFLILPASENAFVPALPSVPMDLNHFEPLLIMTGTFAKVSTLLSEVGAANRP